MTSTRVKKAVQALRRGEKQTARSLLLEEVRKNPSSLEAWIWAVEVASHDQEKITILRKILTLDPGQKQARRLLNHLIMNTADQDAVQSTSSGVQPAPRSADSSPESRAATLPKGKETQQPSRLAALLLLPLQWLFSLPFSCGLILLAAAVAFGGLAYFRANTSFFGLVGADFNQLQVSNAYQEIVLDENTWKVVYEGGGEAKFIGTVRHVSPIRINEFKILTHDILVTSADFADPDLVDTAVINHKFTWQATGARRPTGYIHLLHTVPADKSIYQQLLQIRKWDVVRITGREIFTITGYASDGSELGVWQDAGCNTLLVESVQIMRK